MYIIGLFIYFLVLVAIGILMSRKNMDFDSYFYGQRKLGSFLIFFTVTAAWFGAASTIATAEAARSTGFQAAWLLAIPTLTTLVVFILLNKKIRETHFVSLPVLLEKYYGKIVSAFASFLIFVYMAVLAAAQLVAWGKFVGPFLGQNYEITVITGAVLVILYSYLGGYLSVVHIHGVQFLMIVVSLIYLVIFFKNTTPLVQPGDFELFSNSQYYLLMTVSFTLAWVISPIVWQRIASAKSATSSRWGMLMSIAVLALLYFGVIRVGIYLRSYPYPTAGDVLGFVVKNWLPAGGGLLVFLGIASAIMSTADTAINLGALTLVKDVFQVKRKNKIILYSRMSTFISGLLAAVVALKFSSIIETLGRGSEILADGLFIPGMYMLLFKKKRPGAALVSLVLGGGYAIVVFVNAYGLGLPLPQWPYSLPYGLALSLIGFIIGYFFDNGLKKLVKMKKNSRTLMVFGTFLLIGYIVLGQQQTKLAFTLSLEQSNPGKFHIVFCCEGIKGEIQDFKMPAISPGYYRVLDFAGNVENFNAEDGSGNPLPWEKTAKNTWRVGTGRTAIVRVNYDVKSDSSSVATSFIDDKRAYISSPSVFMYLDGQINHPVTVTFIPPPNFPKISTGLEPLQDKANTFYAPNFDIFYDCPIYLGSQEIISFDVQGISHYVAMENPGTFDRQEFKADLKKMIEAATAIVGDIPYRHYTFIFMGEGKGGLEHLNSSALFITVSGGQNPWLDKGLIKFLAHEYFHLYNVKAIRPIALGPFDYDRENHTDMLWFAEGGTIYYEYIILNRAGFLSRNECLESFSSGIAKNENNPAHRIQSVAEASHKAWTQSFFGSENEISYYDKGLALSILLDLKIRHETKNKKSLDNVISTCYYEFYKKKQRGFTDREFRQVCENVAGISLADFFAYISSPGEVDYPKYFAYAGLAIEIPRDINAKGTFRITRLPNPTPLQLEIFQDWLKE